MLWFRKRLVNNFEKLEKIKLRVQHRFTFAGLGVLSALILATPLSMDASKSLNYQIFSILLTCIIVAWSCRFFGKVKIQAERTLPPYATAGEPFDCLVSLRNEGKKTEQSLGYIEIPTQIYPEFNTFLNAREPYEDERLFFDRYVGYYRWQWLYRQLNIMKSSYTPIPDLIPGEEINIQVELKPMKRGHIILDRYAILKPDPLNLMRHAKIFMESQSIIVLPKSYRVPTLFLPGDKRMNLHAESTTHQIGESEDFTSLREYRPGDAIKHIHWKSTARTGQLTIKQYDEKSQLRYGLLLDTEVQDDDEFAFEETVSLAASFVKDIPSGETLLDLLLYANEMVCLTTGRGANDPRKALEALAGINPGAEGSLKSLHQQVRKVTHRLNGVIAVFGGWSEDHEALIQDIRSTGTPYYVFIVSESLDGPNISEELPKSTEFIHLIPGRIEEGLSQSCV